MSLALSIEELSFAYQGKDKPALSHINAQIEEGSLTCILGHGGAGKSSFCYCLNALIPKFFRGTYRGKVFIRDQEAAKATVAGMSRRVGLVFQDFEAQLFSTNVELEMAFGPENHGLPRVEIERRIHQYLAGVGLEGFRKREPSTLSGGQKQRLAIGSILAMEPQLLVMDEPTTDLDPQGAEDILTVARSLKEQGRTLILVLPEPEAALGADQIWLMRDGELITQGPPDQILPNRTLLRECGIKPLGVGELFEAMEWPGCPLSFEQARDLIEKHQRVLPKKRPSLKAVLDSNPTVPILQIEDLTYRYTDHGITALKGINLRIGEGEFVALLGQNGSGKSTLAKHCNGLLKPTGGQLVVEGRPTSFYSRKDLARRVGYVFQNPDHQIFARTVEEEVGFGLKALGMDAKTIRRQVGESLETVGLPGYEKQTPFTLTKGERQRLAVASVLAMEPPVILLDEPTTGLDYSHQRSIMDLLHLLNRKGHTIIIITHSMWVAAEYANRVVVLKEGAVLLDGPAREVFADESKLTEASLPPPPVVRLSNWLGARALTVGDLARELKNEYLPLPE